MLANCWRQIEPVSILINNLPTDLVHNDVTCPEGSMEVVVMLKSNLAASSANNGGNSKIL